MHSVQLCWTVQPCWTTEQTDQSGSPRHGQSGLGCTHSSPAGTVSSEALLPSTVSSATQGMDSPALRIVILDTRRVCPALQCMVSPAWRLDPQGMASPALETLIIPACWNAAHQGKVSPALKSGRKRPASPAHYGMASPAMGTLIIPALLECTLVLLTIVWLIKTWSVQP